jgi:zinc/manganese transport system substrate-binding protein
MLKVLLPAAVLSALPLRGGERPRVVVLHPLLEEMVQRVAGDAVEVSCLLPPNANVHTFDPTPGEMASAGRADLVVAMGKHLEPYLDRLKENLPESAKVYEAGRLVPSVKIDPDNEIFACCPVHSHGAIDPHWWHSPLAVRRAVRHLGRELEDLLPDRKKEIRERTREVMDELEELHQWTEERVSAIPRDRRKLVTAHAAFGYFCVEYGFHAVPVKGLTAERGPSPNFLKETLETLRRERIRAVFPEDDAPDAVLETLRESAGVVIADHLHADFIPRKGQTYADMFRANVTAITRALAPAETP